MKTKVYVLAAKQYQFTDEETGRVQEGTTVFYVDPSYDEEGVVGHMPLKASLPYSAFSSFLGAGFYELEQKVSRSGQKMQLRPIGFRFLESAPLAAVSRK